MAVRTATHGSVRPANYSQRQRAIPLLQRSASTSVSPDQRVRASTCARTCAGIPCSVGYHAGPYAMPRGINCRAGYHAAWDTVLGPYAMPRGIQCRLGSDASGVGEAELLRDGRQRKRRLIVKHEEEVSVSAPHSVGPIMPPRSRSRARVGHAGRNGGETKRRGSRRREEQSEGLIPSGSTESHLGTVPRPTCVPPGGQAIPRGREGERTRGCSLSRVQCRGTIPARASAPAARRPEACACVSAARGGRHQRGADGVVAELSLPARFASLAELSLASAALRPPSTLQALAAQRRPRGPLHGVADGMHRR